MLNKMVSSFFVLYSLTVYRNLFNKNIGNIFPQGAVDFDLLGSSFVKPYKKGFKFMLIAFFHFFKLIKCINMQRKWYGKTN